MLAHRIAKAHHYVAQLAMAQNTKVKMAKPRCVWEVTEIKKQTEAKARETHECVCVLHIDDGVFVFGLVNMTAQNVKLEHTETMLRTEEMVKMVRTE